MSIQTAIERSLTELWTREKDYGDALQAAADAEHLYRMEYAKAYLKADGSIPNREHTATVQCERLLKDRLTKDSRAAFMKEKLKDSQQALSARQSLLNFERATAFNGSHQP